MMIVLNIVMGILKWRCCLLWWLYCYVNSFVVLEFLWWWSTLGSRAWWKRRKRNGSRWKPPVFSFVSRVRCQRHDGAPGRIILATVKAGRTAQTQSKITSPFVIFSCVVKAFINVPRPPWDLLHCHSTGWRFRSCNLGFGAVARC